MSKPVINYRDKEKGFILASHQGNCYQVFADHEIVKALQYPHGKCVVTNDPEDSPTLVFKATKDGWVNVTGTKPEQVDEIFPIEAPIEIFALLKSTKVVKILKHVEENGIHYTAGESEGGEDGDFFYLHSAEPVAVGDEIPYYDVDEENLWLQHYDGEEIGSILQRL